MLCMSKGTTAHPAAGTVVHHAHSFKSERWTVEAVKWDVQWSQRHGEYHAHRHPTITLRNQTTGDTRVLDRVSAASFWRNWTAA